MKDEMLRKVFSAQKNLIVSGDMATGKTTNVLFPLVDQMIAQKESLLFLDCKEEYINKYHNLLKEKDYNLVVINLKDPSKSDGWNPLQLAYEIYKTGNKDKALDYLSKMAKTIYYDDKSSDPFWTLTAADLFTGVALALFEDGKDDEINLSSINMMYHAGNERFAVSDYLTHYFKLKDPLDQAYICASPTILSPNETKASILSVARQILNLYVSKQKLNMMMNETTFDIEDLLTKPTAFFLIAKDDSRDLNTLAAVFIEQLFTATCDMNLSSKFNYILDDFDVIEYMNDFTNMLSSGISRGIKFVISTRALNNLSNKYGDYFIKISDQIEVTDKSLNITTNGDEEEIENNFEKTNTITNDVTYPELSPATIHIFDLKEFVCNEKNKLLQSDTKETPTAEEANTNLNLKHLIEEIDIKLDELKAQEKESNLPDPEKEINSDHQ